MKEMGYDDEVAERVPELSLTFREEVAYVRRSNANEAWEQVYPEDNYEDSFEVASPESAVSASDDHQDAMVPHDLDAFGSYVENSVDQYNNETFGEGRLINDDDWLSSPLEIITPPISPT